MDELTSICNVLDRYFIELEIPGSIIYYYYYMAESVSAMQLVNLRSVLVIRTKILFTSEKRFK